MPMTLEEALRSLDPTNHDHWTNDGNPRMEVLQELTDNPSLTRRKVLEAAPSFTRDTATVPPPESPGVSPATEQGAVAAPLVEPEAEEAEQLEPEAPVAEAGDEEATLSAQLEEADADLELAEMELNAKKAEVEQMRARRDALVAAREREKTPHDDQIERMRYIQMQNALRTQRAGERAAANELMMQARGMTGASALDMAMARRTSRGAARPPARPFRNGQE